MKGLINQNKGKNQPYSMLHFEKMIEQEREFEELFAIQGDRLEVFEKKWENT